MATTTETLKLSLRGSEPTVNGARMNDTLHHSCQWGCTDDGGMNRLALNDDDAAVRRWFIGECEALGCKVTVDEMGNIFAVMGGQTSGAPIAMGSHLDTQPSGGRYDGILGVLAGLEVLKAVKESGHIPKNPLAVVVWTNEEGARFIPSMLGSAVWAGHSSLQFGHSRKDERGVALLDELERHGMRGDTASSYDAVPLKAHFELHIEQGPILDKTHVPVAAVAGVQAFRWYGIKLQGRGSHAGTTPMGYRHDPLSAFAKMFIAAEELAKAHGGLATIGRVGSHGQQSTNCILDDVEFHLDIRHHLDAELDALEAAIRARFGEIVDGQRGVQIARWDQLTTSAAVQFDDLAVDCVKQSCTQWSDTAMISGAGHDSVHTAKRCPTAMIFIRCKDGVSHHPSEYSLPDDIAIGAKVLLEAVLRYDAVVDI